MTSTVIHKDDLRLIDTLSDALGRSDGQTVEEIKAELEEEGIDVEASIKRLKFFVDECQNGLRELYLHPSITGQRG